MKLADIVRTLGVEIPAKQRWAILGPEAAAFRAQPGLREVAWLEYSPERLPTLEGLLLVGTLSHVAEAETWLKEQIARLPEAATVLVVDWQDDGPLDRGPDLSRRFKKGRLRRLLRHNGFGRVETVTNQPLYYIVKGVKGPAPALPYAGEWVEVASLAELPKNSLKLVELFGYKLVVANTGKEIVAFAQACPHANGQLDQGRLRGRNIVCPLHTYIWNVRTGEPVEPAGEDTLRRYAVRVDPEGGRIWVALTELADLDSSTER